MGEEHYSITKSCTMALDLNCSKDCDSSTTALDTTDAFIDTLTHFTEPVFLPVVPCTSSSPVCVVRPSTDIRLDSTQHLLCMVHRVLCEDHTA